MQPRHVLPVAVLLVAGACSGGGSSTDPTDPSDPPADDVVDARAYYDDYEEDAGDQSTGALPTSEAADASPPLIPDIPDVTEDNTFDDVGDTGFVPTAVDARSTFGLDVDTGSYRIAHRFAEEGYRPPRDSIRVEEWVNSFDHGYDAPDDDTLALSVDTGESPYATDGTRLVQIGIATQELAPSERPPAAITFVVDTSGSMDIRERLGLVKSSLALLVTSLRPDDTIAVVTYGDESRSLLEPTPVAEHEQIVDAIDDLQPGGSTNMEAGLRQGYRNATEAYREDAVNVVLLASDGVANVGVSKPGGLVKMIERRGRDGIHLVTVGYGMGNYNDTLMEQLANRGDGFYSYLDTFEEAEALFVDELTPTLTTVARDAKSQVTFDPAQVESYRLIGYENRAIADDDFRDDTVDAGELGAGHTVTALYEVRLADGTAPGDELGSVAVRWQPTEHGGTGVSAEVQEVSAAIPAADAGDPDRLAMAATIAAAAEVLRGNADITGRQITLAQVQGEARRLADAGRPGAQELADYLATVRPLKEAP
ncbi:MAG: von Willebrand factor type A domain-containing protein [Actinomycetota bacterium]|nr:von Willebrand factor type A domain-containing protein [Actinomycetota bacterium]